MSDFDMMAAFNRKSSEDIISFMESLAIKFGDVVPGVNIKRVKDSFLSKNTHIESITIPFKDCKYVLENSNKIAVGKCLKESGGIVIKTETLSLDVWIANLMNELEQSADSNTSAAETLHNFLME